MKRSRSVDGREPDSNKIPKLEPESGMEPPSPELAGQAQKTAPRTYHGREVEIRPGQICIKPLAQDPDEKAQRYDRQLRLWEASGQEAIENASMMISPSTATSSQILKNLILPGICRVNLYDENIVRQCDIGNDFFLEQSSLGKNRAAECARRLEKLNPATFLDWNDCALVEPGVFDMDICYGMAMMSLIIGVRMTERIESELTSTCWSNNVPLILVQTCGLVASIRVQTRELGLFETHPDSLVDLRLDCPFPSLIEFVKSFDMSSMDDHDHAHIPAVVIIIHFLEIFKSNHGGKLPKDSSERDELKKLILAEKRNVDEDNFDEAVKMIWKACKPTLIPKQVQDLFSDDSCKQKPNTQKSFWLLVRALREFAERRKAGGLAQLPLSGVLPDMKSDTKNYVKLRRIYQEQAQADLLEFQKILESIKTSAEDDDEWDEDGNPHESSDISDEMVTKFVKNSAHIQLIRGRAIDDERDSPHELVTKFQAECDSECEPSSLTWYLALRACALFRTANKGRYPGERKEEKEADLSALRTLLNEYLVRLGYQPSNPNNQLPPALDKALEEIVRSAGSELPQISALVGGMVAQESIKLITKQYVPLNGTLIFDGIKSCTGVLNL